MEDILKSMKGESYKLTEDDVKILLKVTGRYGKTMVDMVKKGEDKTNG